VDCVLALTCGGILLGGREGGGGERGDRGLHVECGGREETSRRGKGGGAEGGLPAGQEGLRRRRQHIHTAA
jgi:hypothetical protein